MSSSSTAVVGRTVRSGVVLAAGGGQLLAGKAFKVHRYHDCCRCWAWEVAQSTAVSVGIPATYPTYTEFNILDEESTMDVVNDVLDRH
jgi:hypothetical protein